MKKKMIALSLSSILLFGCGSTKPASDECCNKVVTEQEHHEKILNGAFFGIIVFAILSAIENTP